MGGGSGNMGQRQQGQQGQSQGGMPGKGGMPGGAPTAIPHTQAQYQQAMPAVMPRTFNPYANQNTQPQQPQGLGALQNAYSQFQNSPPPQPNPMFGQQQAPMQNAPTLAAYQAMMNQRAQQPQQAQAYQAMMNQRAQQPGQGGQQVGGQPSWWSASLALQQQPQLAQQPQQVANQAQQPTRAQQPQQAQQQAYQAAMNQQMGPRTQPLPPPQQFDPNDALRKFNQQLGDARAAGTSIDIPKMQAQQTVLRNLLLNPNSTPEQHAAAYASAQEAMGFNQASMPPQVPMPPPPVMPPPMASNPMMPPMMPQAPNFDQIRQEDRRMQAMRNMQRARRSR